jgi:hypothetical protein
MMERGEMNTDNELGVMRMEKGTGQNSSEATVIAFYGNPKPVK